MGKIKMWQWVALALGAFVLYNLMQPKQGTSGAVSAGSWNVS